MIDVNAVIDDLRSEMALAGIPYTGQIQTGKFTRFDADGEKGQSSWYVLYVDGHVPAGEFGCWRRGIEGIKYKYSNGHSQLSKEEFADLQRKIKQAESDKRTEAEKRISEAKRIAQRLLSESSPATLDHPYLKRKRCGSYGEIRCNQHGELVLPLRDIEGSLFSIQLIAPEPRYGHSDKKRDKDFLPGGRINACFYTVSDRIDSPLVICEGYATGASIHEATGYATVCAMSASNLKPVAAALRSKFPSRTIIIAADNDRFTENNPGKSKAAEAAKFIKAHVVHPEFSEQDLKGTDFNDLMISSGPYSVKSVFDSISPLSFLSLGQILSLNLPPENVFVGDHVLSAGNLLSFLAAGGVGKSFLIEQMACSCAARLEQFLAWKIHPSAHNLRWLIIQAENSAHRCLRDSKRIRAGFSDEQWALVCDRVQMLVPLCDRDSMLDLDNPVAADHIRQSIELFQPDIVVFDALYNFTLRELSKGADMLSVVSSCVRLTKYGNPNRTPVIAHHALPGASGNSRAVGSERATFGRDSKILHQLARCVVNIIPISENSNDQLLFTCGKNNDAREFHPFVVKRNQDTLWFELDTETDVNSVLESTKSPNARKRKSDPLNTDDLLHLLDSEPLSTADWAKAAMNEFGASRATFFRIKHDLEKSGSILKSKINKKWNLVTTKQETFA